MLQLCPGMPHLGLEGGVVQLVDPALPEGLQVLSPFAVEEVDFFKVDVEVVEALLEVSGVLRARQGHDGESQGSCP